MHPKGIFLRIEGMRDEKDKDFQKAPAEDEIDPVFTSSGNLPHVPRGLFSRIIKRLGLEEELVLIKKHLGFFTGLLIVFLFLSLFALVGLRQVLRESSFGPFVSLAFSDPEVVFKYRHSFFMATFESVPGMTAALFFFSVAFLMLFVRLTVFALEKFSITTKLIDKQKYTDDGNK